jgi:putative DNA primase/helicase
MANSRLPRRVYELAGMLPPSNPASRHLCDMTPAEAAAFLDGSPPSAVDRAVLDLSQVRASPVDWLWPGRIPFGQFTILDGDPGLGKSTLLLDLAARLTTARPMPDEPDPSSTADFLRPRGPASVVLLSAEDGLAETIRPRLEAAGADLTRVAAVPYLPTRPGEDVLRIPRDLGPLARLIRRRGARLLIVDPLLAFLEPRVNAHSDQMIRLQLMRLAVLAELRATAVVLVRHLTKQASRTPLYRGGGSIGLIGSARSGLLVAHDPDDPSGARRLLVATKSNLGPPPPALAYRLVTAPNGASVVHWEGLSPHTAETALSAAGHEPAGRAAVDEAKAILTSILGDGPVAADLVRRQAAQAGLGPSLLWRAKLSLGIRSQKVGQPGRPAQSRLWSLPQRVPSAAEDSGPLDSKSSESSEPSESSESSGR